MLDEAWEVRLLGVPHHQDDSLSVINTRRDVGLPLPPSGARNLLGNSGKMALSHPGDGAGAVAVGVAVALAVPCGVISTWLRGGGGGEGVLNNRPANEAVNWRSRSRRSIVDVSGSVRERGGSRVGRFTFFLAPEADVNPHLVYGLRVNPKHKS